MTRVLLAEDEEPWLILIKRMLERNGFEVSTVEDAGGVEARAAEAEVLVVDAMLGEPVRDFLGVVAIGKLLREGTLPKEVPVVFVSVNSETDSAVQGKLRDLGIPSHRYVWLQKPFEEQHFVEVIRSELEARAGSSAV